MLKLRSQQETVLDIKSLLTQFQHDWFQGFKMESGK